MRGVIQWSVVVVCIGAANSACWTQASTTEQGSIEWEPFVGVAFDGNPMSGELGRIEIPENRVRDTGATIRLAFVRYRTTNPNPGPPILFLPGGPGASSTEFCAAYASHPQIRLLEHSDVIGIDQRGTGLSEPNLMEPEFVRNLSRDRAIDRADVVQAFSGVAAECVAYWRERGIDLDAYNTAESAEDVEAVRRALGFEKIVVVGSSYGSHLALAYLRAHAEHVDRALLLKVEGPDDTWKLPSVAQACLERLDAQVAAEPSLRAELPDLVGAVERLLAQLAVEPATVLIESAPGVRVTVRIGAYDLQCAIAQALATTDAIAGLPALIHACVRGDWSRLGEFALENRRVAISAMPLMMDCASGGSVERLARIKRERGDPRNLLSDALMAPFYPESCSACGSPDLGAAFRAPVQCMAPTLFVSGALDARTPPDNVEAIRAGFGRHAHIVAQNAAHDGRELMSEEFRDLVQMFLRGEAIESCSIALPPVILAPLEHESIP